MRIFSRGGAGGPPGGGRSGRSCGARSGGQGGKDRATPEERAPGRCRGESDRRPSRSRLSPWGDRSTCLHDSICPPAATRRRYLRLQEAYRCEPRVFPPERPRPFRTVGSLPLLARVGPAQPTEGANFLRNGQQGRKDFPDDAEFRKDCPNCLYECVKAQRGVVPDGGVKAVDDIASCLGAVVPLLSRQFADAEVHNVRAACVAGLSVAMGIITLQPRDGPAPLAGRY